ncbi:MAG: ABC transporter ATP-binding protein [Opitutaceae bacterium]
MNAVIQAENLSRFYGIVMGLNNISFAIEPGLTGLVGPNGAGKTTLIRLVTGQIRPSSGRLHVFGRPPWDRPEILGRIGYCPEGDALHGGLTPIDWLVALGGLSGLDRASARRRAEATLDQVGLEPLHRGKLIAGFSKGMKQRVKLAQALLHRPDLLVLDEPMNGLDPMGRREIGDLLREEAARGVHILVSSHILPELESLCGRLVLMNWGRVLAAGSRQSIRNELQTWSERVTVRCDQPGALARSLLQRGLIRGFEIGSGGDSVSLVLERPAEFYDQLNDALLESGTAIREVRSETRSLHQIFERMTR